jgi:DNA modification methylase
MKPVELIENAILNNSKENDLIFDAFLGSGTTLIACEKTNRICYGIELDEHYCQVIIDRYKKYTSRDDVQLIGNIQNF